MRYKMSHKNNETHTKLRSAYTYKFLMFMRFLCGCFFSSFFFFYSNSTDRKLRMVSFRFIQLLNCVNKYCWPFLGGKAYTNRYDRSMHQAVNMSASTYKHSNAAFFFRNDQVFYRTNSSFLFLFDCFDFFFLLSFVYLEYSHL